MTKRAEPLGSYSVPTRHSNFRFHFVSINGVRGRSSLIARVVVLSIRFACRGFVIMSDPKRPK